MANGWGGKREGAGRRKGAQELATRLRDAAKKAMDLSEAEGVPLEQLLKAELQQNPLKFVQALAPLVPKELEVTQGDPLDALTDDDIADLLARLRQLGVTGEEASGTAKQTAGAAESPAVH